MISIADAQKVIARSKKLVAPMAWAKKLNHSDPVWHEHRSALEYEDDPTETPEGLMIVCQWKRKDGVKPETWNFGLLYGADRIYAIDSNALQRHKNTVGVGRPYFRKYVHGIHEHLWSEDGQGYAEPFTLEPINGPAIWKAFVERAGISDPGFIHPDKAINDGQQEFDI